MCCGRVRRSWVSNTHSQEIQARRDHGQNKYKIEKTEEQLPPQSFLEGTLLAFLQKEM